MTALLLLRRLWPILWPILAALSVIGAAWAWGNSREAHGRSVERAAWETEAARLRAVAAQEALQRQAAVTVANDAARASSVALDALADATEKESHVYYKDRPVVRCLDDNRVRAIAQADAAAVAAAGAAK